MTTRHAHLLAVGILVVALSIALPTAVGAQMVQQVKLTAGDQANSDSFGLQIVLSADGTTAVIAAWEHGAAFVYVRSAGTWIQQARLAPSDGASVLSNSNAVAISADGSTAIVGAYGGSGAVYVFTRTGTTWSQQQKLMASDVAPNDAFGGELALSAVAISCSSNPVRARPTPSGAAAVSGSSSRSSSRMTAASTA